MKKILRTLVAALAALSLVGMIGCSSKTDASGASNVSNSTAAETSAASQADNKSKTQETVDGVRPEVKTFCDDYESIMNEYCDFMETYDSSDPKQITKYTQLMTKYAKFAKEAEDVRTSELSTEENIYLMEVLGRVNTRLAEVNAKL